MKNILLFGAGKSATVLIEYLKELVNEKHWTVTVADNNLEMVKAKTGLHTNVFPVEIDIDNHEKRRALIKKSALVISMLPPHLHFVIAEDCLQFGKHFLTASYLDDKIKILAQQVKDKKIIFLYEMGLDPGIDHMSAMKIIHQIQEEGGTITSFKSHCGGLIAPESDTNPWHYKISWNPRNIVMAGKQGAIYKLNNAIVQEKYHQLFNTGNLVETSKDDVYAWYANRNSIDYMELYGLNTVATFIRTTLRHPEFVFGWKNIIDLKLTDEDKVYETTNLSLADFFKLHLDKNGFSKWLDEIMMKKLNHAKDTMERLLHIMEEEEEAEQEGKEVKKEFMMVDDSGLLNTVHIDDIKEQAAEAVAASMNEANLSLKQLFFLGMDDDETLINKGLCSAADVLQFALETKLALLPTDKDMIVMLHEIEYKKRGRKKLIKSLLQINGEDSLHTAMAKTVGLPLGIAARLILDGIIEDTGLHIPIIPSIYNPVLDLLSKRGIEFRESLF